ncbi:deoxyribose-phosphate aldolase [Mycetocola reblochoni]|nr:deoxyribose-phosphate aldolase [Mycetocola reblochoni]RLP69725.1 deoxyribose-phosphate aldolase [Mycetocola reblochoni]
MIDHAILKPELTRADVDAQLAIAREYRILSVCVRPSDVRYAVEALEGSGVGVGTVIGFPHGTTSTTAKVAESRQAIADGAFELDMVVNIGWVRSGLLDLVEDDIRAVVEAAGTVPVKVIIETSLLNDEQKVAACLAAEATGAAFVKTSTGFAGGGATVADITLMRATVGPSVEVKASGGIRSLDDALAVIAAGASRLGTSATATLITDLEARTTTGVALEGAVDTSSY